MPETPEPTDELPPLTWGQLWPLLAFLTLVAGGAGGRYRAAGAAVSPDALSLLAFGISALIVGVASLVWWVWRRG